MVRYSAGIVTAYGAAKRAGYTGTYEDFCRQQAGYAENAAAVEQAKTTAVNAAATATTKAGEATAAATAAQTAKAQTEQAASQAQTDISTAKATALSGIDTAKSTAVSAVQSEGQTQTANARAQAQAASQSAAAAQASATTAGAAKALAEAAATNAATSATNAATSATNAAQSASDAQAVLESIPEDYSDLSEDVDKIKADLNVIDDYIIDGEYDAKPKFVSGTTQYYEVGREINHFVAFVARKRTDVIDVPTDTKIYVSVDGNYMLRVLNAGTNGIITEVSEYVSEYSFICGGQYVVLVRDKTNPNADITDVDVSQYVKIVYEDFYFYNKIASIDNNSNAIFNCDYPIKQNWYHGTSSYVEPGDRIDRYTTSGDTGLTRQRTKATAINVGRKIKVSVSGNYLIRLFNAGTDGIITSVTDYVKTAQITCDGMYLILFRGEADGVDISGINPDNYVNISVVTKFNELQSEIDDLQDEINNFDFDKIIPVTQSVPATANDYYNLWETLVIDGYCTKTQIATVNNIPIYKYVISKDNDTLQGDPLTIVRDGSYYSKPKISMISGVHGDEKGSPLFLYEFINRMCRNKSYGKYIGMFDFYIIPMVNPTGYNLGIRENYNRVNINRDATESPTTVEGQALKAHFDANEWACCFDFHQMSHGLNTSFSYSCGYMALCYGASKETTDKYNKLFSAVGYETELLMEKYTEKTAHRQMFQPWNWVENYDTWTNYPVNKVHKTDTSFIIETAQTWYYYSNSGVDLNPIALSGGNTFTDKLVKILLENV